MEAGNPDGPVVGGLVVPVDEHPALPSFKVGPFEASVAGNGGGPFHGQIHKLDTRDFRTASMAANLGGPSAGVILTMPVQ